MCREQICGVVLRLQNPTCIFRVLAFDSRDSTIKRVEYTRGRYSQLTKPTASEAVARFPLPPLRNLDLHPVGRGRAEVPARDQRRPGGHQRAGAGAAAVLFFYGQW